MRNFIFLFLLLATSSAYADPVTIGAFLAQSLISIGATTILTVGQALFIVGATIYGSAMQRRAAKKAKAQYNANLEDKQASGIATDIPLTFVYGKDKVGGNVVAMFTSGDKDQYRHLVVVLANHESTAIDEVYVAGKAVGTLDGSGWATTNGDSQTVVQRGNLLTYRLPPDYGNLVVSASSNDGVSYSTLTISTHYTITNDVVEILAPYNTSSYLIKFAFSPNNFVNTSEIHSYREEFTGSTTLLAGATDITVWSYADPAAPILLTITTHYTISGTTLTVLTPYDGLNTVVSYHAGTVTSYVRVSKHLGTSSDTADSYLLSTVPNAWTANHLLRGHTYIVVTLDLNYPEFQSGAPAIQAIIRGRKLYDPRLDSTVTGGSGSHRYNDVATWAYSTNPALVALDYITSSIVGMTHANLLSVLPYYQTAANVCDETITIDGVSVAKYTANGVVTSDQPGNEVLEKLADAMAGSINGTDWTVFAGSYIAPTITLNHIDDVVGSLSVISGPSKNDVFNTVRGRFTGPENDYAATDVKAYVNATYLAADGEELDTNFDFPFTNQTQRIHNLASIRMEDVRNGLTISGEFSYKAWRLRPGDRVMFNSPPYTGVSSPSLLGMDAKVFRIIDKSFKLGEPIKLTMKEDAADIWDAADAVVVDSTKNTNLLNPFRLPAVVGFAAASGDEELLIDSSGSILSRIKFSWTSIGFRDTSVIQLQYRRGMEEAWNDVTVAGIDTFAYAVGVSDGDIYYARIRILDPMLGSVGPWAVLTHTVVGKTAVPANYDTLDVTFADDGTRQISFAYTSTPTPVDLAGARVRYLAGTGTPAWGTMTALHDGLQTASFETQLVPAGAYVFAVKAVDTSGNESTTPIYDAVTVPALTSSLKTATVFVFQRTASTTPPSTFAGATTYTFSTGVLSGTLGSWTQEMPTSGSTYRWMMTAQASSTTDTDSIAVVDWSSPALISENGEISAPVMIYRRASSAPTLPSATATYTFATGGITGLNNSWTAAIPAADGNPLYVSKATASAIAPATTDTIASGEWSTAVIMAQDGDDGAAGLNNATVYLYRRNASTPAVPSTLATYTFATGVLTGHNNSWTQAVPASDGNPLYVTAATASSNTTTDTIATGEWASPVISTQDGLNSATVFLYQRASSAPSVPASDTTYTFATGILSGTLGSWTQTVPAANNNPCYVTTAAAIASAVSTTDTIATGNWATPTILANDAKTLRLTADGYTFTEPATSTTLTPSWITLTVLKQNTSANVTWTTSPSVTMYTASSGGSAITQGSAIATTTVYMRRADYAANTSVLVTASITDGTTFSDSCSIVRLVEGFDGITSSVPNGSHTVPFDNTGVGTYTNSGTTIRLYEGSYELAGVSGTPAAGQFNITGTTLAPTTSITVGAITYPGSVATVADHSAITQPAVVITYAISGKRQDGTAFTTSVTQTITKSVDGDDAKTVTLAAEGLTFTEPATSTTLTPATIMLTVYKQNTSANVTWTTSPTVVLYTAASGGSVVTQGSAVATTVAYMRRADYGSNTSCIVTASITDGTTFSSSQTITRVLEGWDGLTVKVSNPAFGVPFTNAGVGTYTGSGTTIEVLEGGFALSAVSGTPVAGQFTVAAPVQTPTSSITVGTITFATTIATVPVHSALVNPAVALAYAITGKRQDGTAFTLSAAQTITKVTDGTHGTRTAFLRLYQWRTGAAPSAATGTAASYNWTTGVLDTTGLSLGSGPAWALTPGTPTSGQKLYVNELVISNTTTSSTTTSISWTGTAVNQIGEAFAGADGARGTITAWSDNYAFAGISAWTDGVANRTIDNILNGTTTTTTLATTTHLKLGDTVTEDLTADPWVVTKTWNGSAWSTVALVVNGNAIVTGTFSADKITTGTLEAARIAAGSLTADKLTAGTISTYGSNTIIIGNTVGDSNVFITKTAGTDYNLVVADTSSVNIANAYYTKEGGSAPCLIVESNVTATGNALQVLHSGGGANSALSVERANGSGDLVSVAKSSTNTGKAVNVQDTATSNSADTATFSRTTASGTNVNISNTSSATGTALAITHSGAGSNAAVSVSRTNGSGELVSVAKSSTNTGKALNVQDTATSNSADTATFNRTTATGINVNITNSSSATGSALVVDHSGAGSNAAVSVARTNGSGDLVSIAKSSTNTGKALNIQDTATSNSADTVTINRTTASGINTRITSGASCTDTALLVSHANSGELAAQFENTAATKSVLVCGTSYALYTDTGQGNWYIGGTTLPFTGAHLTVIDRTVEFEIGDIVSETAIIARMDVSNASGMCKLSDSPKDRTAFGVIAGWGEIDEGFQAPADVCDNLRKDHTQLVVNGIGEGQVNVCGLGGDIEAGDFICTSTMSGKGMRQNDSNGDADDLLRRCTVARARESVTFNNPNEVKMIACIYLCG